MITDPNSKYLNTKFNLYKLNTRPLDILPLLGFVKLMRAINKIANDNILIDRKHAK